MAPTKETGSFTNVRGQKLYSATYLPEGGNPDAVLVFHHGLGEYTDRYDAVFNAVAAANIAVYTFDAHGHGLSEPTEDKYRVFFNRFSDCIDDQWQFISETVLPKLNGKKLFLGGHSLGGLISATTLLEHQDAFAGLILHSAAVDIEWTAVLRFQAVIGNAMAALFPFAKIVPAVRPQDMSQDPKVVEEYLADKMIYQGNVRARSGNEILKGFRNLKSKMATISVPVYACHGTADRCTSRSAVKNLLETCASQDKTMDELEGGYHELFHGPEKEEATAKMVEWLKAHA